MGSRALLDHRRHLRWHDKTHQRLRRRDQLDCALARGATRKVANDFHRNARDNFLVELAKTGLGKRDIGAQCEFFRPVVADDQGTLAGRAATPVRGVGRPPVEMSTLVVLTNTPHHSTRPRVRAASIDLVVWQGTPPARTTSAGIRALRTAGASLSRAYAQ